MQAETNPNAEGNQSVDESLSFEDILQRRLSGEQVEDDPSGEESAEEPEEPEESEEPEDEEVDDDEDGEEESKTDIDLLSLSVEQIQELAKKGKSRLLQRFGELTAKAKSLEEKLAASQPAHKEVEQSALPDYVRGLDSAEKLQAKFDEMERSLEMTDAILEEYEDYGPEDLITVGDKEYTKRQIRQANRNAREALTKFLPAQGQHLAKLEQFKVLEGQWTENAKKEVPEIQDEESEIGKRFKALSSDPLVQQVKERVPEIGFQIDYILAHAARSIFGQQKGVKAGAGEKIKVKASSIASTAKGATGVKSKETDALKRFKQNGSLDDLLAARIARFSR